MPPATDQERSAALEDLRGQVAVCTRCRLHETRTQAVFGEGDANATLMFVGEAPGYHEDKQGRPFVGPAGKLLQELLATIHLSREQVYIANVLKSRPPNNRDPQADEIEACTPFLVRQIEIIRPLVICSLGNFATKFLADSPTGITRAHGHPQRRRMGDHSYTLFPIFHPAAALYTPSMLETLREDFRRLPRLLVAAAPETAGGRDGGQGGGSAWTESGVLGPLDAGEAGREEQVALGTVSAEGPAPSDEQLGLF